jgi:hypothetical protein
MRFYQTRIVSSPRTKNPTGRKTANNLPVMESPC